MKGVGNFAGFAKSEPKPEDKVLENVKRLVNDKATPQTLYEAACESLITFRKYTWVGIYMIEGKDLVLKAWRGPQATNHVRIPVGQGVCGAAAASGQTEIVPDVSRDSRYIECFPSTKSEIVVPIKDGTRVYGEIDVDADALAAFGEWDKHFLEKLAFHLMLGIRGRI